MPGAFSSRHRFRVGHKSRLLRLFCPGESRNSQGFDWLQFGEVQRYRIEPAQGPTPAKENFTHFLQIFLSHRSVSHYRRFAPSEVVPKWPQHLLDEIKKCRNVGQPDRPEPDKEQLYNALVGNDPQLHRFGVLLFYPKEWQSLPDHNFSTRSPRKVLSVVGDPLSRHRLMPAESCHR